MINLTMLIQLLISILMLGGVSILIMPLVVPMFSNYMRVLKNKNKRKSEKESAFIKLKIYKHISFLLNSVFGYSSLASVLFFFILVIMIFILSIFILFSNDSGFLSGLLMASFVAMSPYAFLRVKLYTIRISASHEAHEVIVEFSHVYKIMNLNMSETISYLSKNLKRSPKVKKLLKNFTLSITKYSDYEELEDLTSLFAFSIDTEWAMILSQNMLLSLYSGYDVSSSLDDLVNSLNSSIQSSEHKNRYNFEAKTLIYFTVPVLYGLLALSLTELFGLSLNDLRMYQLKTAVGVKFLVLILIATIFGVFIDKVVSKAKFDI
jgi:hypothetical protein